MIEGFVDSLEFAIRQVVGNGEVDLHSPRTTGSSRHVLGALMESKVSVDPELTSHCERRVSEIGGTEACLLTSSGTAALHLALRSLGVTKDDTVICPAISFVATANAIMYCGAAPFFVDVNSCDLSIDPERLRSTLEHWGQTEASRGLEFPKVMVAVSVFGLAPKLSEIERVAEEYGVSLLVDAAGALGTQIDDVAATAFGSVAVTSFNGNKVITAGCGGAIFSRDTELLETSRHLSRVAKIVPDLDYFHDQLGYNYRMPAINAALLLDQIENFASVMRRKRDLHDRYSLALDNLSQARLLHESPGTRSNYWLNSIELVESDATALEVVRALVDRGLGVRPLWLPLPLLPHLKSFARGLSFPVATRLHKTVVSLPSSYHLVG